MPAFSTGEVVDFLDAKARLRPQAPSPSVTAMRLVLAPISLFFAFNVAWNKAFCEFYAGKGDDSPR